MTRRILLLALLALQLTAADITGNWTFTQTIIDALRGDPLMDHNGDGVVCGRPLSPKQQEKFCATHECTVPIIMDFRDNDRGNL